MDFAETVRREAKGYSEFLLTRSKLGRTEQNPEAEGSGWHGAVWGAGI